MKHTVNIEQNTTMKTYKDYLPETKSLLESLESAGCKLISGHDGEEKFRFTGDHQAFAARLAAVDESRLFVLTPDHKKLGLYLVFGNEPGVLVADYHVHPVLDAATQAHYDKWFDAEQPMIMENCPGYAGPAPEGVNYSDWLAINNID